MEDNIFRITDNTGKVVYLTEQSFYWNFSLGVDAFVTTFVAPRVIAKELVDFKNPVSIYINRKGQTGADSENHILDLKELYLINHYFRDDFNIIFTIADKRILLQGKKTTKAYNVTLLKNSRESVIPNTNDPVALRIPYETLSNGRYAIYSVKGDGKPYNLSEITFDVLNSVYPNTVIPQIIGDYTPILENIVFDCVDTSKVLKELLSLTRLGIGVFPDGKIYVFSLIKYNPSLFTNTPKGINTGFVLNGAIFKTDKRRARPVATRVHFDKKIETLLVATKETDERLQDLDLPYKIPLKPDIDKNKLNAGTWYTQEMLDTRRVISCVNVVRIPYPVILEGKSYNVGEYVPIELFYKLFRLPPNIMNTKGSLGDLLARRIYLGYSAFQPIPSDNVPLYILAGLTAEALRGSYRKLYMIDSYYIQHIKEWFNELSTVVNNYDRKSLPAQVFGDYCYLSYKRTAELLNFNPLFESESYNWKVKERDLNLTSPSPAAVRIVDKALGVFLIDYQPPLEITTAKLFPFCLSPDVPYPSTASPVLSLDQSYPAIDHTLMVLLSTVWRTDVDGSFDNKRFYRLQYNRLGIRDLLINDNPEPDEFATFPRYDIYSDFDFARIEYPKRPVVSNQETSKIPTNENFLDLTARYESYSLYNDFEDRYNGKLTMRGFNFSGGEDGNFVALSGNLGRIIVEIGIVDSKTTYEFLDYIPYPSEYTYFPQKYVDFIRRQINRDESTPSKN